MSTEQDHAPPESSRPSAPVQQQQPQQPEREGHAGRGSDSALRQLRIWEERRAVQSGGKRRQGPQ
jgi:hypothetical protein